MSSKIILTSAAVLLTSVSGANAFEYRPFVGLTMGAMNVMYSGYGEDYERAAAVNLPSDFFAFGIEGGVRAGAYNDIYNGGLTLSAIKTTYSSVDAKFTDTRRASIDGFSISATYDNYIRISGDKTSRIDLVLGAGLGTLAYHVDPVGADNDTRWSFAPEFKAGLDFELTHNVTLSANARVLLPTRSDHVIDASYLFGGTVKYLF